VAPATGTGGPSALPAGNPYSPPSGYNYRGASAQGSAPLVPTRPESRSSGPLFGGVAATGVSNSIEDRTPRPVDDTAADGGAAGRKPIISTIQPRVKDEASNRPTDIADLPKTPAGGP
jgi:hypothetical protein